jgi:hypothetical protein
MLSQKFVTKRVSLFFKIYFVAAGWWRYRPVSRLCKQQRNSHSHSPTRSLTHSLTHHSLTHSLSINIFSLSTPLHFPLGVPVRHHSRGHHGLLRVQGSDAQTQEPTPSLTHSLTPPSSPSKLSRQTSCTSTCLSRVFPCGGPVAESARPAA